MRIISTVPSQTELLYDLGLDKEVVGITKFCVHPKTWYKNKTRIGGTKSLDIKKIKSLKPDLIIANKEENIKEQILSFEASCQVLVTEIKSPEDNLKLIEEIALLTNKRLSGIRLKSEFQAALKSIKSERELTAAYLIWKDPYMTVGTDTYIHSMMKRCGLINIFGDKKRYPQTNFKELKALNPEVLLLSSEPYPFKEKHLVEIQNELPKTKIKLVDGEAFSWYGTRLIHTAEYLRQFILKINI